MQIRSRLAKAGMLGAAAAAALAFSAAPASAAPAVTASPSTGLSNGQTVTVTGSGYPAGAEIAVSQCGDGNKCTDTLATATVGADGGFTANYTVQKVFTATDWSTGSTVSVDCAVQQCQLVAYLETVGPVGTDISFG
ncbi:enediyne antibiotic chromoprotein [Streptomyces sp. NPDC052016]|uniref:enediyne antibiotic chromoprotein n=1 Tax=unclassified Streptomyces TaxID=2593676 RepID=UPI00343DAEC9